jgi:hypothetical protein
VGTYLKIGIMGTYLYFDNSELWEHIQSELWHLSFGIMGSFQTNDIVKFRALFGEASLHKKGQTADFTLCVYSVPAQYL